MSGSWLGPFEQAGSGIIYRIDLEVREQAFRMLAAIAMSAVDLVECGRAANRLAMRAPGRIAAIVGRPNRPSVGVPIAADMCISPLSFPT